MSNPGAVDGDASWDVRDDRITLSQDGLHNRNEEEDSFIFEMPRIIKILHRMLNRLT